jgi:uncharacterized membrane protein
MLYETFQNLHSWFAYFVIIVLFLAVINAIVGLSQNKNFTSKDLRVSLFALIFTHLQLLIGFVLYFVSPKGSGSIGEMKISELRLTWLEHPLMNIIAIVLITIGWSKHKKMTDDKNKFKKIAFFYGVGLLFILSRIPYASWF